MLSSLRAAPAPEPFSALAAAADAAVSGRLEGGGGAGGGGMVAIFGGFEFGQAWCCPERGKGG